MTYKRTGEPLAADDGELPLDHEYYYRRREQLARTGRWGSCAGCPKQNGIVYPERCRFRNRDDHNLS